MPLTRITSQLISIPSNYPLTGSLNGTASYATTASFAMNGGSGGSTQTGSIANQTVLYNVTTSQENTITGLDLSGNKWDVSVIEEWNSGSIVGGDLYYPSCSLLMHFSGSNGSTTFIDNSPVTKSFTVNGNSQISTAQSKFGSSSLYLDGTGDYLSSPNTSDFAFGTGDFTIECWAYRITGNDNGILQISSTTGGLQTNVTTNLVIASWNSARLYIQANNTYYTSTAFTNTVNTWNHYALVRNSGVTKLYFNGNLVTDIGTSGAITDTTNYTGTYLAIGGYYSTLYLWNGYIDELRITKGVARYTGSFTPQTSEFPNTQFSSQLQTKYIGLVGGINDSNVDYGVEKLSDTSLKIRKMTASGQPLSGSGTLSASVDRVYVNVLNYDNVSISGSISNAISSSYSLTASYNLNSVSSSFANTSSYSLNTISSSYSNVANTATSATSATSANTATSSSYATVAGSATSATSATSANTANSATSASYSLSSSFATNAVTATSATSANSASYSLSSSYSVNSNTSTSSSFASTASYNLNSISSSFSTTSSYNLNSVSSSYSLTASYALNSAAGGGTTLTTGSTYPITSSWATNAITASYALNASGGGGSGGSTQTGSIANQTVLYNVTTSQDNVISGLNLSSNKWGVTVVEEWNSGSIVGDEYYNSCSLLLHFNGSNGSTTFIDNSPSQKTITANNGAAISTAQSKFGGTSGLFDGTDDYLNTPSSADFDFGTGDFTVEFWVNPSSLGANAALVGTRTSDTSTTIRWCILVTTDTGINVLACDIWSTSDARIALFYHQSQIPTGQWTHCALVRYGTSFKLYQNGVQSTSGATTSAPVANNSTVVNIGSFISSGVLKFNGYMDEVRITKGVARYTASFTTQSIEFPNSTGSIQYATKYVGLVGGLNDSTVDYGVEKLSDSSLKIRKMSASGQPLSGSGTLSASVDRVYVNVLDYTNVMVTSSNALTASYATTASYAMNGGSGGGSTSLTGITFPYVSGSNTYTLSQSAVAANDLLLSVNGVVQTPTTDYTVSASSVTFTDSYPSGSSVNVRYLVSATSSSYVNLNNIVLTGTTTGDAYYPQVAALLHFDGVNGSTIMTDSGKNNLSFTVNGNSQISTAQSKIGGASLYVDGTGDYISSPSTSDLAFGTGDFTIEFWAYRIVGSDNGIFQISATSGGLQANQVTNLSIFSYTSGRLGIYANGTSYVSTAFANTVNTWNHYALVRNSSVTKLYFNGNLVTDIGTSGAITDTTNYTGTYLAIGGYYSTSYLWNGYIDELRITKGYARYTGNFTPSTTAFSNTGGDVGKALVVNSTATGVSIGTAGFNLNSSNINRVINGAMAIDQRNAGASQTITASAALAYTADRWYAYCTGANVTGQRITGSANNQYAYRFTGAASVTGIGFGQRIEAANSFDLAGSTVTIGVDLANSVLTSVTWTVYYANTSDTFGTLASPTRTQISTGTFTVNSTLSRYSTQIFIPSAATTGIEIVFSVGAQTSGTWTIDNVQLEAGPLATPFERRLIGTELNLCYRYFVNLNGGTNPYQQLGFGTFYSSTNGAYIINLPTQMRTLPSVTYTGTIYILYTGFPTLTGFLGPYSQIGTILEGDFTVASGGTVGTTGLIRWNNVSPSSRTFFVSSEL